MSTGPSTKMFPELCHLAALAGYLMPFGNILGPLTVWLLKRREDPRVDAHGKAALNFQISVTLYTVLYMLVGFLFMQWLIHNPSAAKSPLVVWYPIFFVPLVLFLLGSVGLIVWAAVRANRGDDVRYPFAIRFLK